MVQADVLPSRSSLPARHRRAIAWASAIGLSALLILLPAVWNGFPFMFYDSGAFIDLAVGGGFRPERSAFYGLFLWAFHPQYSLWPAAIAQVTICVLVMAEFARIVLPGLSPMRFFLVVFALSVGTGLPWYAAQILPDIWAPLMVISLYLLGFHGHELGRPRQVGLMAVAILAITSHSSHLALAAGLVIVIAVARLVVKRWGRISPAPRWRLPALVLAISLASLVVSNFARTGDVFVSRAGPAFVLGRLMQDGIVQRLLHDTCPASGYDLCPYKDKLPNDANDYLWRYDSPFWKFGGFEGTAEEAREIIGESLKRYPWMHVETAVDNTLQQLVEFETGDGIEPLNDVPVTDIERWMPDQLPAYYAARQQQSRSIDFHWINMVQVPLGALSLAALGAILAYALRRRIWDDRLFLPAFLLIALLGNAFVCGVLSNPHDRYQSRLMWPASFAAILLVAGLVRSPPKAERY
jgi:hypothetical protein